MYETMDAANGVGVLAANQVGVGLRLFVYDCADDRGESTRRRGVVINPVLETSDIPETMPDPTTTTRVACRFPANRFRAAGPSGRGSPVWTPTAIRSPSRATGCSLGCCSTRPDIWTGSLRRQAHRPACQGGQAGVEVQRLGCSGPVVDARRGAGSVRPLMDDRPSPSRRVSVRYRIGSVLTDVIGMLEALAPEVSVRPKTGGVVRIPPADVVSMRELSAVPVRASEIRALEHAAALAGPEPNGTGIEGGCSAPRRLHRSGEFRCAVGVFVGDCGPPEIVDWYAERGLPAWLALPERLSSVREIGVGVGVKQTRVMVADLAPGSMESVRLEPARTMTG